MHLYDLARAYIQWCSQVMGIGQAPTVHYPLTRASREIA